MKFKNIVFLFIALFMTFSCSQDLDVVNPNTLTPDQFWQNEEDALKAVTAMYATNQYQVWGGKWGATEILHMTQEARTDMVHWSIWQPMQGISRFNISPTNYMTWDLWTIAYQTIFAANFVIENVSNVPDLSTDKINTFIAEAKFIRAHNHFMLLTNFGNIVLATKNAETSEEFYRKQSPAEAVWAQIEQDLKDAKAVLPASWDEQWLGRATKGAATAYLGKVLLYQNKWESASKELKEVTGMGYALIDDFGSLFTGLSAHSKESVFTINYSSNREGGRLESNNCGRLYWRYTQNRATDFGRELFLNDKNDSGELSKRFYASVLWDDPKCDAWYWEGKTYREYYGEDDTNMYWKKWVHNHEWYENIIITDSDYPIIRYADVLLMLAEALNESGQTSEAIPYVNQVRERAGAALIGNMNQIELRTHIRHVERPLEFVLEGTRFYDMTRWYGFGKDGGLRSFYTNQGKVGAENFVDGESEFQPIPQDEIDANPDIIQNPGY